MPVQPSASGEPGKSPSSSGNGLNSLGQYRQNLPKPSACPLLRHGLPSVFHSQSAQSGSSPPGVDSLCKRLQSDDPRSHALSRSVPAGDFPARPPRIPRPAEFYAVRPVSLGLPHSCEVRPRRADEARGEARMSERSELLEAALDGLPDGVALLGKEEWIVFWNRAAEAI